jgi:alanyl-tRNA synthetase
LGKHVEQKGSFVNCERLRFDFSHFGKMTKEELRSTESMVNQLIRDNISINDYRNIPIAEAEKMGAMALFGEKYGDRVRVVQFGDSIEFCGGTHVLATGKIGYFKIISEAAIAAGVRRIEAITATAAMNYVYKMEDDLEEIKAMLNNSPNVINSLQKLTGENEQLKAEIESFRKEKTTRLEQSYLERFENTNGMYLLKIIGKEDPNILKEIASNLRNRHSNAVLALGTIFDDKPGIILALGDDLVAKGYHAASIVREAAKLIQGGGGGQPFLATAGGKNQQGLEAAIEKIIKEIKDNTNEVS